MATYRRSYVFRLGSDPVCRLWTGVARLVTPADDVDPSGATWEGAGALLAIPPLKALINGIAERVRFSVSGVSPETLRLAQEDRDSVRNASLRLGWVEFDEAWQVVGGVHWDWLGTADVLVTERTKGPNPTRTIALSAAAADTTRSNPPITFWTAADQRRRSSDDAFCDQAASMTQGMVRRFGPK